jgi:phosphatidate cytidylyltransferase
LNRFPGLGGRLLVAIPGICLFLWVVLFAGDTATLALFSLLSGLAGYEAARLCRPSMTVGQGAVLGICSALLTWLVGAGSRLALPAVLLPGAVLVPWRLFRRGPDEFRREVLGALGPAAFYSLGFGILGRLAVGPEDRVFVLLPLVTCWTGDTLAYLVGCRWGRHKMLPRVSPGKSWEGFAAGLAGSGLAAAVLGLGRHPVAQFAAIGLVCGAAGVLGDLFESAVKRDSGLKDSGTILGGHGGIMDRFDSVAAAAPAAAAVLMILGKV